MSVATGTTEAQSPSISGGASTRLSEFQATIMALLWSHWPTLAKELEKLAEADDAAATARERSHVMSQMGAKRIGSLAIGIGVVGIVLNQMSNLEVVGNSTGVIDVSSIFQVAGQGLNLLVIGVIIAAAAVLLSLWSGF
jgi:hypothetical protein